MTDLFVLTADADALAVMNTLLARPGDLGIRSITFRVDRRLGEIRVSSKTGRNLSG